MAAAFGRAAELRIVAARSNDKQTVRAAEAAVVVVTAPPFSRYTWATELAVAVVKDGVKNMARASEVAAVIAYVTGGTERFDSRSWGFNLDQHQFVVYHLGVEGTFVYDVLTGEFSQWETEGFTGWNAEHGIEWNDEVYFADRTLPTLWKMAMENDLDEDFRVIRRVVTGGLPIVARGAVKTGMFVLSTSPQAALVDDADDAPTVTLSISDDGGKNFRPRETIEVDGNETQDIAWKGLGMIKAPGRVFKIEDQGGFIRIDGANQKISGEKDGE